MGTRQVASWFSAPNGASGLLCPHRVRHKSPSAAGTIADLLCLFWVFGPRRDAGRVRGAGGSWAWRSSLGCRILAWVAGKSHGVLALSTACGEDGPTRGGVAAGGWLASPTEIGHSLGTKRAELLIGMGLASPVGRDGRPDSARRWRAAVTGTAAASLRRCRAAEVLTARSHTDSLVQGHRRTPGKLPGRSARAVRRRTSSIRGERVQGLPGLRTAESRIRTRGLQPVRTLIDTGVQLQEAGARMLELWGTSNVQRSGTHCGPRDA